MRYYVMRRMIRPGRFAEDQATSSKQLRKQTEAEAVEYWEDEGGAFSHGDSIVVGDLSSVRVKVKKGSKCT